MVEYLHGGISFSVPGSLMFYSILSSGGEGNVKHKVISKLDCGKSSILARGSQYRLSYCGSTLKNLKLWEKRFVSMATMETKESAMAKSSGKGRREGRQSFM